jgi:hypothetical protein
MLRVLFLAVIGCLSIAPVQARQADGSHWLESISTLPRAVIQSPQDFARAVRERSTSPHYVRILVNGGPGYAGWVSCMPGEDLNRAVRREYDLASDREGMDRAADIAIARADRTFTFSDASALGIVMPTFSDADLTAVRAKLAPFSNDELRAGFSLSPWGGLHAYFRNRKDRDAAACVLIERHLSPGIADRTGSIYID